MNRVRRERYEVIYAHGFAFVAKCSPLIVIFSIPGFDVWEASVQDDDWTWAMGVSRPMKRKARVSEGVL